jgi:hypothetical protein
MPFFSRYILTFFPIQPTVFSSDQRNAKMLKSFETHANSLIKQYNDGVVTPRVYDTHFFNIKYFEKYLRTKGMPDECYIKLSIPPTHLYNQESSIGLHCPYEQ